MRPRRGRGGGAPDEILRGPLDGDLAADQLLDGVEREDVVVAGERDGGPFRPGAARPADAVDIVLRVLRQIVVYDV